MALRHAPTTPPLGPVRPSPAQALAFASGGGHPSGHPTQNVHHRQVKDGPVTAGQPAAAVTRIKKENAMTNSSNKEIYDVIVVGGGAAGCVVAGNVAMKTKAKVLMLEAGGNDSDFLIHLPAGYAKILQHDRHVWKYETVPQKQLDGKVRRYRSGKVIGGGSSVNAMCYVRGQRRDYARWQAAVGDTGQWSYDDLLPNFIAQEKSDIFHNEFRGVDGTLGVSLPKNINSLNQACLRAFQEYGLPYNPDYNGAQQRGVSPVQTTLWNSRRCSSADAHLVPALSTGRLTVSVNSTALRVLIKDGKAVGVEYLKNGKPHTAYGHQIIVSSGSVHTPKILMHSGIGAASQLEKHGIKTAVDSPEVGMNLQDHPIIPLKVYCKGDVGYQKSAQGLGAIKAGLRYFLTKDGPAAGNGVETVSYWNPDDLSGDPTIQCYHVPIISEDGLTPSGSRSGITFELVVMQPHSRGSVALRDGSPTSMPLIDPNFMGDARDMQSAIRSIRAMREVMEKPSLRAMLAEEMAPGAAMQSDAQLAAWLKSSVTTMWHPVGTCRMGSDDRAVVDARLRVNGVENLRVIDASIMPNIVSGNTNGPTQALAGHGVNLFLQDFQ